MASVKVYNIEGKEVGSIELNDSVFGVEINEHLVHMAVVSHFICPGIVFPLNTRPGVVAGPFEPACL